MMPLSIQALLFPGQCLWGLYCMCITATQQVRKPTQAAIAGVPGTGLDRRHRSLEGWCLAPSWVQLSQHGLGAECIVIHYLSAALQTNIYALML